MGLFGLLSGKKEVTTSIKNELNKELDHYGSLLKKLNTTDSVSAYFKAFDDMLMTFKRLKYLEDTYDWKHGKFKWKGGVMDELQAIQDKKAKNERAFVERAYERLQRDCLKVTTDKAKEKKRTQFFAEFEHYNNYFEASTIEYIETLK